MSTVDVGLAEETGRAAVELSRAILSLRPLAEAGYPLRVIADPADPGGFSRAEVATSIARSVGIELSICDGAAVAGRFDEIVAALLGPPIRAIVLTRIGGSDGAALDGVAQSTLAGGFDGMRAATEVATTDGARLRTYVAGDPGQPAIVLASACGMPARLCEPWMRFLARDHQVVTWETRGLFGELRSGRYFDGLGHDVAAQAGDLVAVMDHHGLSTAHVMGLCGGAVVALWAAANRPDRIASLSLWHGDFSGTPGPTTGHQDNLKALMSMAAQSREDAAAINSALAQTALGAVPAGVAHLVVYPYLTAELFYRYCVLTGATMTTDLGAVLPEVRLTSLVVTSADDHTAHPAGSHQAAARLPDAQLRVEPHGDHISVFGADPRLQRILTDFLATVRSASTT
jgi:pimeloyl-ACP methyl ester carboxylesterase